MIHACNSLRCTYQDYFGNCTMSGRYGYPDDARCMQDEHETYGDSYDEDGWLEDDGEVVE